MISSGELSGQSHDEDKIFLKEPNSSQNTNFLRNFDQKNQIMDIQTRKIEFVQEFLKLQNEELIARFEKLLRTEKSSKKEFQPWSLDEFNKRIDKSLEDSKNGRLTNLNDLMAEIEKWE